MLKPSICVLFALALTARTDKMVCASPEQSFCLVNVAAAGCGFQFALLMKAQTMQNTHMLLVVALFGSTLQTQFLYAAVKYYRKGFSYVL